MSAGGWVKDQGVEIYRTKDYFAPTNRKRKVQEICRSPDETTTNVNNRTLAALRALWRALEPKSINSQDINRLLTHNRTLGQTEEGQKILDALANVQKAVAEFNEVAGTIEGWEDYRTNYGAMGM